MNRCLMLRINSQYFTIDVQYFLKAYSNKYDPKLI